MVDTLVSGASASRRVGSTPIIRTLSIRKGDVGHPLLFYHPLAMLSAIWLTSRSRACTLAQAV